MKREAELRGGNGKKQNEVKNLKKNLKEKH